VQPTLNRILVLEDNPLIAMDQEAMLRKLSGADILVAASVGDAQALLDRESVEFALLDVDLAGETSEPVAKRLQADKVPFAFVSGYESGGGLGDLFAEAPSLVKPLSEGDLRNAMRGLRLLGDATRA
jgi:DNA-binding response OmpR family regulator